MSAHPELQKRRLQVAINQAHLADQRLLSSINELEDALVTQVPANSKARHEIAARLYIMRISVEHSDPRDPCAHEVRKNIAQMVIDVMKIFQSSSMENSKGTELVG